MYDFFDRDHANNYLVGTIVRHGVVPTMVHQVDYIGRTKKMTVLHCPLREMMARNNRMEEFDFKPVRLGMFNFSVEGEIVEAAWLQRYPARRWKVGLDRQGMCVVPCRKAEDNVVFEIIREKRPEVGQVAWFAGEAMADMLEGKYPTLQQAVALIGKRTRCSIAFSRNFAVTGNKKLIYRNNDGPVGVVKDGVPTLSPEYIDLQEILQEDLR